MSYRILKIGASNIINQSYFNLKKSANKYIATIAQKGSRE